MKISINYPKKINIKNYYIKSLKFKDNKRKITNKIKKFPNKFKFQYQTKMN